MMAPGADARRRAADPVRDRRRLLGLMVVVAGLFLLGRAVALRADRIAWQAAESARFDRMEPDSPAAAPAPGEALARLTIDRLGLEAMVARGSDPETLALGPGHVPGSALPGGPGNCIIAGHRDADFRRLRNIRKGDLIELSGRPGRAIYRVDGIDIVDRDDTALLGQDGDPRLTLVTCYPFFHVGPAPRRFIVRADLVSSAGPERPRLDGAGPGLERPSPGMGRGV
jgi:sortase A